MNIYLDADVLFDLFARRQPFYESIGILAAMQALGDCKLWTSPQAYSAVSEVLAKEIDPVVVQKALARSLKLVNVGSCGEEQVSSAATMGWESFDDALTVQCARHCKADYILSRAPERLGGGGITVMLPERFFTMLETDHNVSYESVDLHTPLGRHGAPRAPQKRAPKRGRHSS